MPALKKDRRSAIEQVISNVYLTTGMSYPHDGLIEIVSHYGIDVADWDFCEQEKQVGCTINGAIKYPEDGIKRPLILVNKRLSDTKKTYALGHEFGHYLLHEKAGVKLWLDFYDFEQDTQQMADERDANYFAGVLLMPKNELLRQLDILKDPDLVAKYFGVSRGDLDVRLAWIGDN